MAHKYDLERNQGKGCNPIAWLDGCAMALLLTVLAVVIASGAGWAAWTHWGSGQQEVAEAPVATVVPTTEATSQSQLAFENVVPTATVIPTMDVQALAAALVAEVRNGSPSSSESESVVRTSDTAASQPQLNVSGDQPEMASAASVNNFTAYGVFNPSSQWNWNSLAVRPSFSEFLSQHGLNEGQIQDFVPQTVSWEPALYVTELQPELYGNVSIPLLPGYVYTLALADGTVEVMWGGDPAVPSAKLLWGFTARWVPSYGQGAASWLDISDPRELAAREYRFGRYLRNSEMQGVRQEVVYFNRVGPYYTGTGNLNVRGWVPPPLDSVTPRNYMDACAMLGGLCNEAEWAFGEESSGAQLNWGWRYSEKVPGSADYCPQGDPCWQTVYVPDGPGYVEIWLSPGTIGPGGVPVEVAGPYKFFASDRHILADGFHNVDEFSYHADPNR